MVAGDSPAKCVRHQHVWTVEKPGCVSGHRFSDAESLSKADALQGPPIIEFDLFRSRFEHVSRLEMPHSALNWRYIGATSGRGLGDGT